jgi:hypothetical protein
MVDRYIARRKHDTLELRRQNIILEHKIWVDGCYKTSEDQETNMPMLN